MLGWKKKLIQSKNIWVNKHILFISIDNFQSKSSNKKSYGHLVEMGKIMSIVDFVNAAN